MPSLDDMRRYAVARSLIPPTTLKRSLHWMGFVQADPIRAPARAQDLILRHRVKNYRAGDLERRYAELGVHEDFFINYGFVTSELQALMHPRRNSRILAQVGLRWPAHKKTRAQLLLEFVRERGVVHPQEVDRQFSHGSVKSWSGTSNATTRLLDALHYQGLLRVAKREKGIRMYSVHEHGAGPADKAERDARLDALVDAEVHVYAPMPARSLVSLVRRMQYAAPQWQAHVPAALKRAKQRLAQAKVDGIDWYWPADEDATGHEPEEKVRLLAPFDPVVWDRYRFELLWGWVYRFEAYTPAKKRVRGYYALPMLWRDRVIGWANLAVKNGELEAQFGYVDGRAPEESAFRRELEVELERVRKFLGTGARG